MATAALDKSTLLQGFNSHFFDFIDDIISVFPDNKILAKSRISFETIKRANPTIIIKAWYKFVYLPYKDIIAAGNIQFIYEKDFTEDLAELNNADKIMKSIDTLREPIRNMSDANKQHTMKYIQNLSDLSIMYAEMVDF